MDLSPALLDIAHYVAPAGGAWFGARGRLRQLAQQLEEHVQTPVPPAHPQRNGVLPNEPAR